jgi:tRNA A-37 threonylcarbamoyl transferase component Bud32
LPSTLGRYLLRDVLGEGGSGTVYRAWDPTWDRFVALKVLRERSPVTFEELKREFRAAKLVRHRNVARCYELDVEFAGPEARGRGAYLAWVAMELVDGVALDDWLAARAHPIAERPSTDPQSLRGAAAQLVAGVAAIHKAGLLHLDIKPQNILVDGSGRLAIVDFGAAARHRVVPEPWFEGWITPAFAAPERFFSDEVGPGADWFSVGVVLYLALTGRLPERAKDRARWGSVPETELDAIADVRWRTACAALLAARPEARSPAGLLELLGRSATAAEGDGEPSPALAAARGSDTPASVPLAHLREAARQASHGNQRRVWLVGSTAEVGEVITALGTDLVSRGWKMLTGQPYGRERVPFNLFDGIAEQLAVELWADPGLVPDGGLAAAATTFPVIALALRDTAVTETPERGLAADLVALLSRMAAKRPLCLTLGDLSWGDRDSAHLFLELHLGLLGHPVLLVLGSPAGSASPFEEELRVLGWWEAAQARDVMISVGQGAVGSTSDAIHGLSPPARRALHMLALLGGPSQVAWLRELGDVDAGACDELVDAGLVRFRSRAAQETLVCASPAVEEAAMRLYGDMSGLCERAAVVLASDPSVPAERVARLWSRAGQPEQALSAAERAAQEAEAAGAFDRAARVWEWVSELRAEPAARAAARASAAECHVRAGHRAHAASLVEALAESAPEPARAAGLRLRAADLWLGSGHPDRGRALLTVHLPYVGARSIHHFVRGVVASVRARRSDHDLPDAAWTATRGLLSTDWLGGCVSALVALLVTSEQDPRRWARARIVAGGVVLAPMPGPLGRLGRRLLAAGEAIGERTGDPYLRGIARVIRGQMNLLDGRWSAARTGCLDGLSLLEPLGTEVEYERNIGRMGWMRATEELGDYTQLPEAAPDAFQRALRSNDRYAALTLAFNAALGWLARGEASAAETILAMASDGWEEPHLTLQDVYLVRTRALLAAWNGDASGALRLWEALWPRVRRSAILAVPLGKIDVWVGRGRAALSVLDQTSSHSSALEIATEAAQKLRGSPRPDGRGHGELFHAALAMRRGRCAEGHAALGRASAAFAEAGMTAMAACAHLHRARLDKAETDVARHTETLQTLGITAPERWTSVHAPGLALKGHT